MLTFLDPEERETLGQAYPRFKARKSKNQKQDPVFQDSYKVQEEKEEKKEEEIEEGSDCVKEPEEKEDNEVNKEVNKDRLDIHTGLSISDPTTMLARLNTKRLHKRIVHLRKQNKDIDVKDTYPQNMTTEQIAMDEWQGLLTIFRENSIRERKKRNGEYTEEKEDEPRPSPIPASCELLLFSPCPRAVAVLASYPRSGNSLLRTLYEKVTLRVTGSDMAGGLTKHDLVGEMATQTNSVQFVKTHYPERRGSPPFKVDRAVLLVRNPYDAMDSYFNLMMTNTHTTSLTDEQRKKSAKAFEEMARKEILVWKDFHEYWLQQKIPLLVIRYEDLIRYTDKVMEKVIKFTLEINDMRFFDGRIDRCIREEQIERLGSYKPRAGGVGKSLNKYSPDLLGEINHGIVSTMGKFGYSEMLVPEPEPSEWELKPLDQYGVYIPGKANANPLIINRKMLVRGPKRQTNWMKMKRQMNTGEQGKCTCPKCVRAAKKWKDLKLCET